MMTTRSLRLGWFFLIAVGLERLAEGAVVFVEAPSGTVYYPPQGFPARDVRCVTNATTNISWFYTTGEKLDPAQYQITSAGTVSTLSASYQLFRALPGKAIQDDIYCNAGNTNSSTFDFKPGEVPSVANDPVDVIANAEKSVGFVCVHASTRPEPTIFTWRITDSTGTNRIANITGNYDRATREIAYDISAVQPSDAGNYTCLVTNEFDTATSKSAVLTVHYFLNVVVTVAPSTTVHDQTSVTVECRIDALPAATEIRLSRGDGLFFSSSNASLNRDELGTPKTEANHVTYTFTAKSDWTGTISCYGMNIAGSGDQTVNFTVQTRPIPPTLCLNETRTSTHSLSYLFVLGDDGNSAITQVTMSCYRVKSDDTMDKTTEYNKNTTDFKHPNCTTDELPGLIPGTKYGCQLYATNGVGRGEGSARFDVTTVKAAPAKPILDASPLTASETSLTVHWTVAYNGGEEITEYTVRRRGTATGGAIEFPHSLTNSLSQQEGTYTLQGLTRGTRYYVDVRAKNSVDTSTSDIVAYKTLCLPSAPGVVTAIVPDDFRESTRILRMEVPSDNGCGAIAKYIVSDDETPSYDVTWTTTDGSVDVLVRGLDSETEYSLQVSVENVDGAVSSLSEPVMFRTARMDLSTAPSLQNDDGGLSTTLIIVIVVVVVVLLIIVLIIILCLVRSHRGREEKTTVTTTTTSNPDGIEGNYYKKTAPSGYNAGDTRPHPGPNSGSTYSPRATEFADKDFQPSGKVVYTEVDLGDEQRPTRKVQQREKVEYAAIDRDATRKRREERDAETRKHSHYDEPPIEMEEQPVGRDEQPPVHHGDDGEGTGGGLSSLV